MTQDVSKQHASAALYTTGQLVPKQQAFASLYVSSQFVAKQQAYVALYDVPSTSSARRRMAGFVN